MDDPILPRSILLFILLCCSAFFSACEAAFFSLNSLQTEDLKEKKGRSGRFVHELLEKPRDLLITIYIGNELVNIGCSVVVTSIAITLFGSIGVGIAIGVGTLLLLIFGEIFPKSLSLKSAAPYALIAAYPLKIFSVLVHPARRFFTHIAEKFIAMIGFGKLVDKDSMITDEEFKAMVQMGEGDGVLDSEESTMIHNVIEFGETTAGDIMVPKIDMVTMENENSFQNILPKIMENFFARVPVLSEDGETVIGILYTKELIRYKNLPPENFNLKNMLHPPHFVPKSKKIKELLEEFRKMKQHLAIVLDEYGSLSGLITLEDILEELVGEIDSEMRKEEEPFVKIKDNTYRMAANYSIYDFNQNFAQPLPEDGHETVGGLVFGLFGRVPRSGETVSLGCYKFHIEKMKGARIISLRLNVMEINEPENPIEDDAK
ncbi:MAG: HlyC/CorC family transporter [Candidatus Nitrohelix vancouverensis]|uniref:HlyC/CorC family transporter n=1 Tax=Candidatus Nitrohelix vancouverensis TaxID=2705534 RepID=A0A7T0C5D7_9BACT|nr:MAG: HlyC/CorC family transporter [Candidatus Nitrohelix vancouverensis]